LQELDSSGNEGLKHPSCPVRLCFGDLHLGLNLVKFLLAGRFLFKQALIAFKRGQGKGSSGLCRPLAASAP